MFNELTALGYGIVIFAVIIGVGSVILSNFASTTASCPTDWTYNTTSQLCGNGTATTNPSTTTLTSNYLTAQLGQGGLAGWTPAVIAIAVGLLFLGAFIAKGGKSRARY